jgi:5-methylcytosine-specific restriction endonuclease McrA
MKTTLVLNNNYSPLGTVNWQRAMVLLFENKAELIEEYDTVVHTPTRTYPMPAVIKVMSYVRAKAVGLRFNKENIFIRDKGKCQYCSKKLLSKNVTFDHIQPKSKGGETTWTNIVTCCYECNQFKGDRSLSESGLVLVSKPVRPASSPINMIFKLRSGTKIPKSWEKYFYDSLQTQA